MYMINYFQKDLNCKTYNERKRVIENLIIIYGIHLKLTESYINNENYILNMYQNVEEDIFKRCMKSRLNDINK